MDIKKVVDVVKNYVNDESFGTYPSDKEVLMELACLLVLKTMGEDKTMELIDVLSAGILNGYENMNKQEFPHMFHDKLQELMW